MIPYTKYKDSGIKWIGEIPEHWKLTRLKFLADITTGEKDTVDKEDDAEFPFFVRSQQVERISTYSYDGEAILTAGDGVGVAKVFHYINGKFDFHQRVYKLSDFNTIDGKYLFYYIRENFYKEVLKYNAKSTVDSIRLPFLQNFLVAFGSKEEQIKIINFLDKKTSEIDEAITKKEKLITILAEERKVVINEAVTKGIDSTSKMKSSGIDWIGVIPEHWNMNKLRYLGLCQNGISKGGEFFGTGYPFVSYSDVYRNQELPPKVNGLVQSTIDEQENYSVKEGDVFFTRTSETKEEIGIASTCMSSINGATFAGFLIRFRPFKNTIHKGFSKYYFRSSLLRSYFVKEMNLVTRASLGQELLKNLPVPLPSISEQKDIFNYLELKIKESLLISNKIQKEIELLVEYKQALIFEAVTGKIDVR